VAVVIAACVITAAMKISALISTLVSTVRATLVGAVRVTLVGAVIPVAVGAVISILVTAVARIMISPGITSSGAGDVRLIVVVSSWISRTRRQLTWWPFRAEEERLIWWFNVSFLIRQVEGDPFIKPLITKERNWKPRSSLRTKAIMP
jgi:hypothetical protein